MSARGERVLLVRHARFDASLDRLHEQARRALARDNGVAAVASRDQRVIALQDEAVLGGLLVVAVLTAVAENRANLTERHTVRGRCALDASGPRRARDRPTCRRCLRLQPLRERTSGEASCSVREEKLAPRQDRPRQILERPAACRRVAGVCLPRASAVTCESRGARGCVERGRECLLLLIRRIPAQRGEVDPLDRGLVVPRSW